LFVAAPKPYSKPPTVVRTARGEVSVGSRLLEIYRLYCLFLLVGSVGAAGSDAPPEIIES
jgi:hypothetical protein